MNTIHIHEILDIIYSSERAFTIGSLEEEVRRIYGNDVHFKSCADQRFGIKEMVDFMYSRGKIEIKDDRIFPAGASYCND